MCVLTWAEELLEQAAVRIKMGQQGNRKLNDEIKRLEQVVDEKNSVKQQ